jgi:hypothetical protein
MLRTLSGPVYRAWCGTFIPFAALITLALWPWPEISGLVLWWCKPIFDRVLLYVYSQCAFGAEPTVRDVYRALPSILHRSGLLAWLTVYRLGPARSFLLPIWLLERQHGRAARARGRLLKRRAGSYAVWLTMTCALMGLALYVSQILVFEALVPLGREGVFSWDQWISGSLDHTALALLTLFATAAVCVTEPLYIASGFSLYLNRRAELEAWDVELRFRSLAQRKSRDTVGVSATRTAAVALLFLAVSATTAYTQTVPATDPPPATSTAQSGASSPAKRIVLDVLRDPVFGIERDVTVWRPKRTPGTNVASELPAWLQWIPTVVAVIATAARYLVGIAAGIGLAWLLIRLQRRSAMRTTPGVGIPPAVLFGVDVRPESLPGDLVARARQLAQAGDVTAALALLYRGALVGLVHGAGVQFKDGDTERDCLRRASGALQGVELEYFSTLVRSWQDAAYAHTAPHRDAVLGLCDRWPGFFAVPEARG